MKSFIELCEECIHLMNVNGIKNNHILNNEIENFPVSNRAISQIKSYIKNGEATKSNPRPKWETIFSILKYFGIQDIHIII